MFMLMFHSFQIASDFTLIPQHLWTVKARNLNHIKCSRNAISMCDLSIKGLHNVFKYY